ncbi:Hpt domain-containing protein [Actimicrobium sp. CCC2.4]|uniref:Hpt domain-containing protein n=1 Tax=Actimicrobium sp. CCC2.4 TaxID=3048606 RepID=UPI002AC8C57B|nr:Hpt domain-containing protein [Actimicrobium sp. CCC2.4]MEB0133735.1 Hpt domain-containing protein [Actimicrobium sp. CCC2.4]WPX31281.1 Hpt domain-containing protein [Actimicrobium sp. CCC2.4]
MSEHSYCVIDPHFLLQTAGADIELFRELSAMFVTLAGPVHARLALAMQNGDTKATHFESHSLKGSTALVGARELSTLLGEIEAHARRERNDLILPCLPELNRLFALVVEEVNFSLDHFDGRPGAGVMPDAP